MTHWFVDAEGLAGAWSLGTVQAGFGMAHRVSWPGGFGDDTVAVNRHLLGDSWTQETGPDETWTPYSDISFVCGTPPCSAFSVRNQRQETRGPDSEINACMWGLVRYGARCIGPDGLKGAPIISFESVQGAYTRGRDLMVALRDEISKITGIDYSLYHVLTSGSTVGNAQTRPRYYAVFARIPFGIDPPEKADLPDGKVVTYGDALDDLEGLNLTWDAQHYLRPVWATYGEALRDDPMRGVTAHVLPIRADSPLIETMKQADALGWHAGEYLPDVFSRSGWRPEAYESKYIDGGTTGAVEIEGKNVLVRSGYRGGFGQGDWPRRIDRDRPAWVITGGSQRAFAHYDEPRLLTVRELSRLMGYPDSWQWGTESAGKACALIGKCCPVTTGRWLSTWARRALDGNLGVAAIAGSTKIGEREYVFDFTNLWKGWVDWKSTPKERTTKTTTRTYVPATTEMEIRPGLVVHVGETVRNSNSGVTAKVVGFFPQHDQVRLQKADGKPTEWKFRRVEKL